MTVFLKTFEGIPIAMELPQRVTVEVAETEPVVKGQTASSSYKPAVCTNGLKIMVPPHISAGHPGRHQHCRQFLLRARQGLSSRIRCHQAGPPCAARPFFRRRAPAAP